MKQAFLLVSFALCWVATTVAQTKPNPTEVLRQLMVMPAPTPRSGVVAEKEKPAKVRTLDFFDRDKQPSDDAPIEDLIEYWQFWSANSGHIPEPSERVKRRLLDSGLSEPEILPNFLRLLAGDEFTASKVKDLYDKQEINQQNYEWREKLKKWLLFNSKYFVTELLELASKARDHEEFSSVENEDALRALAKVDWQKAEQLLNGLSVHGQPRTRALAQSLFYSHAIDEKDFAAEDRYRTHLKSIAADRNAPAWARDTVIETLLLSEWSSRDEWYLSLFQDETLIDPSDSNVGFSPLTTLCVKEPDKWIPVMARLVEGQDKIIRSAAATCLIYFQNQTARKDALKPLLPWLSNPGWAKNQRNHRLRLIQSMENVDLPESVPGLISVVELDKSEFGAERSYAAQSLAKYRDLRAVPALKKALANEKDEDNRSRIIHGLVASGGLSESEQVEALEKLAAKLATPEGQEEIDRYRLYRNDPVPLAISIGNYLSKRQDVPLSLFRAVMARIAVLEKTNQPLSRSLLELAHRWEGGQIDMDLIERLGAGTADAANIANVLGRREKVRERLEPELRALTNLDGPASGVAAVLLDDAWLANSILSSKNQGAQVGLLVSARLTQMPLPVEPVGELMKSKNELLSSAAERYLLVDDSVRARELLWARYPHKAFITGWRENIPLIGGNNFELIANFEEKLRAELFQEKPPLEIYALIRNAEYYSRVLRVYADRAVYTHYEDPARYRERVINKATLSIFKNSLATSGLEDLGPQIDFCHHNCVASEFLALSKEKGRRVFSHQGRWPLAEDFDVLGHGDDVKIHYNFEKVIKGLEVLYADDELWVKDFWKAGADMRILVERNRSLEQIGDRQRVDAEDEVAKVEQLRRAITLEKAQFSWRTFSDNKLGEVTRPPEGYSTLDETKFAPLEDEKPSDFNERDAQFVRADVVVFSRNFYGLWKQTAGSEAVRISPKGGAYSDPIVVPDGKWVVVAKTDTDWSKPNYIVRFNLETGNEQRVVAVQPASQLNAIAYVAPHGKVLLRRAREEYEPKLSVGPDSPEYYLLDAYTGEAQQVSGVFAPLLQVGTRFLQPTGKANQFWAAIPDDGRNQTQVGIYNLKDFSFQSLFVVPQIKFDSLSMWVDEASAKLYLVYERQLLRMPLRTQ